MKNFLRNPVVLSSIGAIIFILTGLIMPGHPGVALVAAYVSTNTPVPAPTSTPQPSPPSADEQRERAQGIYRGQISGSNGLGLVVLEHTQSSAEPGSLEIILPQLSPASSVSLAYFSATLVSNPPQSKTTIAGSDTWVTTITASPLGSSYIHITVTRNGVTVADVDVKLIF